MASPDAGRGDVAVAVARHDRAGGCEGRSSPAGRTGSPLSGGGKPSDRVSARESFAI